MVQTIEVSDAGIRLAPAEEAVDVLFDEHRVWSFRPARDGAADGDHWLVPWPPVLRPRLRGTARVRLVSAGTTVYDDTATFAGSDEPLRIVDAQGGLLTVDKGGRLQRTFAGADEATRRVIVDTVNLVLADLREHAGVEAFLSFGCLLGAVREGRMIGHDADADVTVLSRHTQPVDIAMEMRRAEKTMRHLGYRVARMSAADFKIWATMPDGRACGIDVFGAYYFEGLLHLLPNSRGDLPVDALLPVSTVTLEGVEVIAPAQPERLLALLYGEGWRVPDPSFKYTHPRDVTRHLGGYWHGTRRGRREWTEFYRYAGADRVPTTPSPFVRWVAERVEPDAPFVEVGYGNGRDAVWLAGQGRRVDALEFTNAARDRALDLAKERLGADAGRVRFGRLNLNDLDGVLVAGARYAFDDVVRHVLARFVIDSLPPQSRRDLWRFASMAQRRGGLTFLEFRTHRSRGLPTVFRRQRRRLLRPDLVVREIEERGGRIVERVEGRGLAELDNEDPDVCRLVVRWDG